MAAERYTHGHIMEEINTMKERIKSIEDNVTNIAEMAATIDQIWTWTRRGLPIIVAAAVSSGIASGKWGAFFKALLSP